MRVLLLLAACVAGGAQAEIYKCVEESGRVTYSNAQSKNCTRLNVGPPNAVPSPKPSASPNASSNGSRNASPGDFPRVDSGTQRARDDDRRRILDQEMANEQSALEAARKSLLDEEGKIQYQRNVSPNSVSAAQANVRLQQHRDQIALHERNIEALRKEIANLR